MDHQYSLVCSCKLDYDFLHGKELGHHKYQGRDLCIFDLYMLHSNYNLSLLRIRVCTLVGCQCILRYMSIQLDYCILGTDCLVHMGMGCMDVLRQVLHKFEVMSCFQKFVELCIRVVC